MPPGIDPRGWEQYPMPDGGTWMVDDSGQRPAWKLGGADGWRAGQPLPPNLQAWLVSQGADPTYEETRQAKMWNILGNPQAAYRAGLESIGMNPDEIGTGSEFGRYISQARGPMVDQSLVGMGMGGKNLSTLSTEESRGSVEEFLRNQYKSGGVPGYDIGARLRWLRNLGARGVSEPGYSGSGQAETRILEILRNKNPEEVAQLVGSQFATRGSAYATNQVTIPALLRSLQREQEGGRLSQDRNVMDIVSAALGGF